MASHLIEEFQAVVDKLHSEGHTIATKLENALADLKAHFKKDAAHDEAVVVTEVKQVEKDAASVVIEAKKDTGVLAELVKGQIESNLAEAADIVTKK